MTLDQFMDLLAKQEERLHEFAKDWLKTLSEQPGFLAHKDEVLAELEAAPRKDSILGNLTELANAYRRVMARHGLPDTLSPSTPES